MGITTRYKCDKCGLEVSLEHHFPTGWRYIKVQRYERAIYHDEDCWLLCTNCVSFIKGVLPKPKFPKWRIGG